MAPFDNYVQMLFFVQAVLVVLAVAVSLTTVGLFDTKTWRLLARLQGPGADVIERLGFAPDGSRLLVNLPGGYLRVWDLRRVREGTQIEEDHMRNRQMIVRWLMANTKAIEPRTRDGKSYLVMVDPKAFRDGVGKLLAEVQRIKSEGDAAGAAKLFDTYGIHFEAKQRDEIVARVDKLNLPSYSGFVMPKLTAVTAADGSITDVTISYPQDLQKQMLEYSGVRK